jgi:hypothetical protein
MRVPRSFRVAWCRVTHYCSRKVNSLEAPQLLEFAWRGQRPLENMAKERTLRRFSEASQSSATPASLFETPRFSGGRLGGENFPSCRTGRALGDSKTRFQEP